MSADARALRVLVVEDEPVNRALLRAVLTGSVGARLGPIEFTESESLAAARAAVADQAPDVVILDVRLPDGSGLDLLRELLPAGVAGRPFVIVMSASVLPADRDAARRSGGDAFLGKPFSPADLVALVATRVPARR
jgi:CheY-like chemotaxis protein